MSVDRLKRDLLNKLINARIDLAAYLQLRKAKGYMSVNEGMQLREGLMALLNEYHHGFNEIKAVLTSEDIIAFHQAMEAIASGALCLLSGCHDCPSFITVDADKLTSSLRSLTESLDYLTRDSTVATG